jgi:hypothetical protein
MTEQERTQIARWVKAWQTAGPALDRVRRDEVRRADTTKAILLLTDAFEAALRRGVTKPVSGLVEQQALFQKMRE